MPIYEFECVNYHRFEQLMPVAMSDALIVDNCPACGKPARRVPSLCAMRPDCNWHFGEEVAGHGYLNSSAQIAAAKKASNTVRLGTRADIEAMKKQAAFARRHIAEENRERGRRRWEKAVAGSGMVNSFGEVRPEAFEKLSDETITRGDDPRIS